MKLHELSDRPGAKKKQSVQKRDVKLPEVQPADVSMGRGWKLLGSRAAVMS